MREKALVILAAGMGSRFGGMKQIEPVGPNGEFIIDYSIYSAIRYGFNKIIFVIKEENYDVFKETVGSRVEGKVKVEYAFQRLEDIPEGFDVPVGRAKPWGTAHAVYAAREYINDNFGVITADDFYGDDAFKVLSESLSTKDNYVIPGYKVGETLSDNGAVKRGVIMHDNGKVKSFIECSCIKDGDRVKCTPLDESKDAFYVDVDHPVSMLINGFTPNLLATIGETMNDAFRNHKDDLLNYEMLLTDIIDEDITNGQVVEVVTTQAKWMGMTYKEDKEALQNFILTEIDKGVYPNNLWN
ncbi:MAG: NTP transferase domain-containing protein [Erysipelotrichales bacterium]|nr:NTP transferase domain-containing protein [Erysipelotrichales bacterium]